MNDCPAIKTPETHPDHPVVGKYFKAYDDRRYYCDSYDPTCGYWMTAQDGEPRRTCVSERVIGRTFHEVSIWGMQREQIDNGWKNIANTQ